MPYITTIERIGREEGMLQNARESVIEALAARFTTVPSDLIEHLNLVGELSLLKQLLRQAVTATSIEEFQQLLAR